MKIEISATDRVTICGIPGTGKTAFARELLRGYPQVYVYDPLNQYQVFDRFTPKAGKDTLKIFEEHARKVWKRGNVVFCIEEAEKYLSNRSLTGYAADVIRRGRNRGIGVIALTRRLADLSKTVFGLSEHVFIFRHFAPNDIKYLRGFIGPEWANRVPSLENYHYLYYSRDQVIQCPPLELGKNIPEIKKS